MNPCEGQRRFKTAGARLPNSRKLPHDFFSRKRHHDENVNSSSPGGKLMPIEVRRPSFQFTFMANNKREDSRDSAYSKNDSFIKLPQLKKSQSDQTQLKILNRKQWWNLEPFRETLKNGQSLMNKTLSKVSLINLTLKH